MSFKDLIPVVNKLQDIVTTTQVSDLDLPILAVVGSQSCGKLSVLENIVGKDFLPRGTGIVTRRPLVLQLVNIKRDAYEDASYYNSSSSRNGGYSDVNNSDSGEDDTEINLEDHLRRLTTNGSNGYNHNLDGGYRSSSSASVSGSSGGGDIEYGEFLHIPNKKFYNFKEIRQEIQNETNRLAGSNKGINRVPINLKIYSTKVLNLTLVDLPGLTKIPIGDQPSDIEKQTRTLISEYISKPNCIILAVSPANVDLVNSESLKLARQVDPTGKRTIGILSKLDLMDEGTNALDILKGNVYPLKLGFVGIVNRSQYDISINKSLTDSLSNEEEFFRNHQAYKSIANKCGSKYLAIKLNQILMSHIRDKLPDIKAKLNTLIGQTEQELVNLGGLLDPDNILEDKSILILNLMTKFAQNFINSIEGTNINEISTKELCGGARLYHIYNEIFGNELSSINPTHNLSLQDIRTAIRNSTGSRPSLFVPELAFDLLVKPQIKLLEDPSKKCVELVYEELMKIVHSICSNNDDTTHSVNGNNLGIGPEIKRYPRLQMKLIEVVSDLLRERLGPTIKYVESLIEINKSYINTNHPNFIGAAKAMTLVMEEKKRNQKPFNNLRSTPLNDGISSPKKVNGNVSSPEEIDDINEIDEDLPASKLNDSISLDNNQESYLNYFFGKDPITHQQYLATQAQLNPTPFKFPHSHDNLPLQFNSSQSTAPNGNSMHQSHYSVNDSSSSSTTIFNNESFEIDESINELNEREQLECELIRRLIISYFCIIREIIKDQVPKSIMCLLVNYIRDNIQNQLVIKLYNENLFDNLLVEDENIQIEREKCMNSLKTYREAAKVINEVV